MISPPGGGSIGPFHPEVIWPNEKENAAAAALTYFKSFVFAPAKAGSTLLI